MSARSLLDKMRELKAHRDEQEAVSYFQDRKGFTVQTHWSMEKPAQLSSPAEFQDSPVITGLWG